MDMVLWSGAYALAPSADVIGKLPFWRAMFQQPNVPSYPRAALILRPDTWSLPLSVKRGSHVISVDGEAGWTFGLFCLYLCWGSVKPEPRRAAVGGVVSFQDAATIEADGDTWP